MPDFATPLLIHHLLYDHEQDLDCPMDERRREPRQVLNRTIDGSAALPSASRTASYFKERAARADVAKALELLDRAGDAPPREGDEIAG